MQIVTQIFTNFRNSHLPRLLIALLIIFKLWLISDQTIWARADFMHDDLLFIRLADNLLQFGWLGPYNNLTLAKGPFYPIWIAFAFLTGIPLLMSQHLLYIIGCLVTYFALRPLIHWSVLRIVLFALLLFNPSTFTFQLTTVLRDALYPSLALLIAGSAIGIFARRHEPAYSLLGWAVTCGLATSAFWLTREEGIWILPFLVPLGGWTIVAAAYAKPLNWQRIAVLTIPLLLPILAVQIVSLANLAHYGVYTTDEFKTPEFKAAYGALTRVTPVEYKPQVPVTRETRQRIYPQSQAFAELQPFFERAGFWTHQSMGFENHPSGADEIGGGWFMWALRDATAAAGYFSSGARASAFFQRLANEINNACKKKQLDCLDERASLMPPWRTEYLLPIINQILRSTAILATFVWLSPEADFVISEGSFAHLSLFRDLTRNRLSVSASKKHEKVYVKGWAVHASENLTVSLVEMKTYNLVAAAKFEPSPDVHQHFLKMDHNIMAASHARFEIEGDCIHHCLLHISGESGEIADIPLEQGSTAFSAYPLWVYLDEVSTDAMPRTVWLNGIKQSILKKIIVIYQLMASFLAIASLIAMVIWLIRLFRNKKPTILGFIALCLIIAIYTRLLILAIIEVTAFPAIGVVYMSPLYPLSLLYYSLFIVDLIQNSSWGWMELGPQIDTT